MDEGHRGLALAVLLLAVADAGAAAAQKPAGTTAPAPSTGPRFNGKVQVAGLPPDPGTTVQVVVFRAGQSFKVCAIGTVQAQTVMYEATLEAMPECVNPAVTYDFYVNGVYANVSRKYSFSLTNQVVTANLSVPEVALKTNPKQQGVRLVWFYGKVRDNFGRPAPAGTTVTAKARGASCTGTGKTMDLSWSREGSTKKPLGILGFYWIGIERTASCLDPSVKFDVYTGSKPLKASTPNISTSKYGRAVNVNVEMP